MSKTFGFSPDGGGRYVPVVDNSIIGISVIGLIPYKDILNSLGEYIYKVSKIKIVATSIAQLTQPITYTYKDANGNMQSKVYAVAIDRGQFQPTETIDVDILLDGKGFLEINTLAGEGFNLYLYGRSIVLSDYLTANRVFNAIGQEDQNPLYVFVKNNTPNPFLLNLFNKNGKDLGYNAPQITYNLSGETFVRVDTVYIMHNGVALTATYPDGTYGIDGAVQALNSLGIGNFYSVDSTIVVNNAVGSLGILSDYVSIHNNQDMTVAAADIGTTVADANKVSVNYNYNVVNFFSLAGHTFRKNGVAIVPTGVVNYNNNNLVFSFSGNFVAGDVVDYSYDPAIGSTYADVNHFELIQQTHVPVTNALV